MWAGDQLLWELRVPGGSDVPSGPSGLDATSATGDFYGRVSYFHAGGIDRPLLITKEGAESVVPRETWRGQFHAGTSPVTGALRDCPIGVQTNCLQVNWPGMRTNASHSWGGDQPDIRVWYGGLVDGMRDASGQMYMRNRYYDPATGQFTQTDPIGIAGGMNVYGFAAGDPVTYSDPYGLCVLALPCPTGFIGRLASAGSRLNAVSTIVTGALVIGTVIDRAHEKERPNFRYHRRESPTQTPEHARLQQENGELWGKAPRYGRTAAAQAFRGPLPAGVRGIEFATSVRPDSDGGALVYWSAGRPDVETFVKDGEDYAKIPIVVTKNTQTPR